MTIPHYQLVTSTRLIASTVLCVFRLSDCYMVSVGVVHCLLRAFEASRLLLPALQ